MFTTAGPRSNCRHQLNESTCPTGCAMCSTYEIKRTLPTQHTRPADLTFSAESTFPTNCAFTTETTFSNESTCLTNRTFSTKNNCSTERFI